MLKWLSPLWTGVFKSPQLHQKSKWIRKQTDREEERSSNSLFYAEEQIFAWTCAWPVCSAEEQPVLYPIRYYSFISRELFLKTDGLCNPSSFQHPDILVPSTDSPCLLVTHLGLRSWSLQPSALLLLFSCSVISLRGPPRFLCCFGFGFFKVDRVKMECIGMRKSQPIYLFFFAANTSQQVLLTWA